MIVKIKMSANVGQHAPLLHVGQLKIRNMKLTSQVFFDGLAYSLRKHEHHYLVCSFFSRFVHI